MATIIFKPVFFTEDTNRTFDSPGNVTNIADIQLVSSSPFDPEEEEWGVTYLKAEIAESEDPLIVMVTGDVVIENDVETASTEGLELFQSLSFITAGASSCTETPNAVFIQSPSDVVVNLQLNGIPLQLGSTIMAGTFYDDFGRFTMWLSVIEGRVIIHPNTPSAIEVLAGQLVVAPLLGDLNQRELVLDALTNIPIIGPDNQPYFRTAVNGELSQAVPITTTGRDILNWNFYRMVELIPSSLLLYDVTLPVDTVSQAVTSEGTVADTSTNNEPCELQRASVSEVSSIFVGPGTNRGVRGILETDDWIPVMAFSADPNGLDETWWKINPLQGTEADRWWIRETEVVTRGNCDIVENSNGSPLVPRTATEESVAPATTPEVSSAPAPTTTEEVIVSSPYVGFCYDSSNSFGDLAYDDSSTFNNGAIYTSTDGTCQNLNYYITIVQGDPTSAESLCISFGLSGADNNLGSVYGYALHSAYWLCL